MLKLVLKQANTISRHPLTPTALAKNTQEQIHAVNSISMVICPAMVPVVEPALHALEALPKIQRAAAQVLTASVVHKIDAVSKRPKSSPTELNVAPSVVLMAMVAPLTMAMVAPAMVAIQDSQLQVISLSQLLSVYS